MGILIDIDGIDFEKSNVTFVNGLTLEMVKIKYNWLLNAKVKDAIIGQNDRGIIWYFGDWICGEWEDGTWYSGNFYNGTWKNGLWYSYKLNKFDVLNEKFSIKQTGDEYSHFLNGYWLNGIFYKGVFGVNSSETWTDYTLYYTDDNYPNFRKEIDNINGTIQYINKNVATWIDGQFKDGLMYDSIWNNGQHSDGLIQNSMWLNGNFYNGIFNGESWYNGNFYNGQFILGNWYNGVFTQLNTNIISRFGNNTLNTSNNTPLCKWFDGVWKNGEWFSGYVTDTNNNPTTSTNNYLSVWYGGIWENGIWYGGHFKSGIWKNGIWKNGIYGFINSTNWISPTNVSCHEDITPLGAKWIGDVDDPTITTNSLDVTAINTANTFYSWDYYTQNIQLNGNIQSDTSAFTFQHTINNIVIYDNLDIETSESSTYSYDFEYLINNFDCCVYINNTYHKPTSVVKHPTPTPTSYIIFFSGQTLIESTNTDVTFIIKLKTVLDDNDGTNFTYWSFNNQINTNNNYLTFTGIKNHSFNVGDYVWIEQNKGYLNSSYNGIAKVIAIDTNSVTTSKKYKLDSNDSGKIIKYENMLDRNWIYSPTIIFQNIDFNYDFITNNTTKVNGYSVKYTIETSLNNSEKSGYFSNTVSLPVKNLNIPGFTSNDHTPIHNTYDYGWYDPTIYTGNIASIYPDINIGKKGTYLQNSLDNTPQTFYYGGIEDLWGLSGLEKYYTIDTDFYNVSIIETSKNKLRIGLNFILNNAISQSFQISNIQIKAFYSDETNIPIWEDGTFEKGTWYNGTFNNGTFISGLWLNGKYVNGTI